ncbi:MAG: energy transducer TonB [Acidobacteriaceae bacterium]|nr:energy transducer TonB [Acidobacteriaceae bacterium]MBV9782080.1 energy transducer TonB [Acidobacteriaceae bacterium]
MKQIAETIDVLDERDPLGFPFIGSLLIHAAVAGLFFIGWYWMNRAREAFGDIHPAGGPAYTVSPVHNIPIPQRETPPNPVANDTQSAVPTAPAKQNVEKKTEPDKNAVEIPDKMKQQAERPKQQQHYTPPAPQNQVYSSARQAVSSPMYSAQSGAGQVGIGPNSPLGTRLGGYAELVRERIAQNWRTAGLDARTQSAPAMVGFTIMRDGSVRNVQLLQSSGNPTIDDTALRAVYNSNPLPPLPPQVAESSISAQFTFNLR